MSSTAGAAQRAAVQREFARQARTFEDDRLNAAFTQHLRRLVDFVAPSAEDVCLDSACGTGLVARALAGRTRHVTALDTTDEMLRTGKAHADSEGASNVVFQRGDATDLPFVDDSFSLVVSRYSLHQMHAPGDAAAELVRVCRPGGRVVVSDMVADPDQPGARDRLERLRDPSHGTILGVQRITDLFAVAGASVRRTDVFDFPRPLATWLDQARTPNDAARQIERELTEELDGGAPTGMRPHWADGELWFTHTLATIEAVPAG